MGLFLKFAMFLNSCGNDLVLALPAVPTERTIKKIKEDNWSGVVEFSFVFCHLTLFSNIISVYASYPINLILYLSIYW